MASSRSSLGGIRRVAANKNFRNYFYGLSCATSGFWAYRVALSWIVWELTHSPAWLGGIVFVEVVPMLAMGAIGGTIVDQHGPLKIVRITQTCWMLLFAALAVIVLSGHASIEALVAISFLQGAVGGLSNPGQLALVANIVPREDLGAAVAAQSFTVQVGRFVGPALAGPLLAAFGAGVVFGLIALCFAWAAVTLFMVRLVSTEHKPGASRGFLGDFVDGFRYAGEHFAIRTIILYVAIMSFLLRPVVDLLPGFADQIFSRGEQGLAWLMASFGLGSVISGLQIAIRSDIKGMTRMFRTNMLIGALSLLGFALVPNFWVGLMLTAVFGMSTNTVSIISQTLSQHMVAGHMRARVMGILGLSFRALPAGGSLIQGWGQSLFGIEAPIAAAAILGVLAWGRLEMVARGGALAREAEQDR